MFARVTRFQAPPEQARANLDEEPPELQGLPGFKGVYALYDPDTQQGLLIALWESKEAMRASEEQVNQIRKRAMRNVGATPASVTVESYEVLMEPGKRKRSRQVG